MLYGTYATVQALDVWTTTRGVGGGARETNPAVASFTGSRVGLTIMKVATTTAAIYFVERLSRRNRVGAIVVMAALNGVSAAQRALAQETPDVIILDVVLPGLNGFEVCLRLKEHAPTRTYVARARWARRTTC